jgi:hypothetical protein
VFRTPFGTLRFDSERVRICQCAESPLADLLGERVSPEMLYLETKFASLVSYGLTVRLLSELLPLDRPIHAELAVTMNIGPLVLTNIGPPPGV